MTTGHTEFQFVDINAFPGADFSQVYELHNNLLITLNFNYQ